MSELTLFQGDRVLVTSSRAVVGETTYPIANITSVTSIKIAKSSSGLVLAVIGLPLLALSGLLTVGVVLVGSSFVVILLFGSAATFGFWVTVVGALLYLSSKDSYAVRIGTAGGEFNAVVSQNEAEIRQIVVAVNQAIIDRR